MFYLSAYLERNRDEYYARLRAVSEKIEQTGYGIQFPKSDMAKATAVRADTLKLLQGKLISTKAVKLFDATIKSSTLSGTLSRGVGRGFGH